MFESRCNIFHSWKKVLWGVILLLSFGSATMAYGEGTGSDEVVDNKFVIPDSLFRLKRLQFHTLYDFDDSAHALIDYTFNQRAKVIGLVSNSRKDLYVRLSEYKELRFLETDERKHVLKTMKHSEYRLSRNGFLRKYGTDDSLKALINVFFNDRNLGWIAMPVYPALVLVPGIVNNETDISYLFTHGHMSQNGLQTLFLGQYVAAGVIGIMGSATGVYLLSTTSKKKLLYYIKYYQENGYLHARYHERISNRIERMKTDALYKIYKQKQKEEEQKKMLEELQKMEKH